MSVPRNLVHFRSRSAFASATLYVSLLCSKRPLFGAQPLALTPSEQPWRLASTWPDYSTPYPSSVDHSSAFSDQKLPDNVLDDILDDLNEEVSMSMIDNPAEAAAFAQRLQQQQATLPMTSLKPAKLRLYQEECIAKCIEALTERGIKKQAVSLPVGSGKTVVFANLLQRVPDPKPGAVKVLVLAHRKELLDQARSQIQRAAPHLRVGMDGGGEKEPRDLSAFDVVVASVPALGSSRSKRLFKYDVNEFKLIVIDEAHHAAAATYIRILEHFGVWNDDSHVMVWGCSATLRRMDAMSLGQVFTEVVYERGFLEMIQDGHLCDFTLKTLCTSTDLSHVSSHSGDYALCSLADTINTPERNMAIVDGWIKASAAGEDGGAARRLSTLVFAATIDHVEQLCATFRERGVDARYLHSRSTADFAARRELVEDFRQGKFPVLVNCGILTEGTDIPNIDCIILARPTRSGILYQQMLGRGLRLHHGKSDCLVIDVVDLHMKADLVTVPSLLGLDPRFVVHDSTTTFTQLANVAGKVIATGLAHEVMSESDARDIAEGEAGEGKEPLVVDPMQYLQLASDVMCGPLPGANGAGALAGDSGAELMHVGDAASLVARDMLKRAAGGIDAADLSRIRTRNNWFFIKAGVLGLQLPNQELLMVDCTAYPVMEVSKRFMMQKVDGTQFRAKKDLSRLISGDSIQTVITAADTWVKAQFPTTSYFVTRQFARHGGAKPASDAQRNFLRSLGYLSIPDGHPPGPDGADLAMRREAVLAEMTKDAATKMITRLRWGAGRQTRVDEKKRDKRRKQVVNRLAKHGVLKVPGGGKQSQN